MPTMEILILYEVVWALLEVVWPDPHTHMQTFEGYTKVLKGRLAAAKQHQQVMEEELREASERVVDIERHLRVVAGDGESLSLFDKVQLVILAGIYLSMIGFDCWTQYSPLWYHRALFDLMLFVFVVLSFKEKV